ncbi:MAG: arylamine N-acetyltransferase [Fodinibius sp.]|nr:arylamine N-acetyltransferase [Fodinibius sp.]
MKRLEIDSPISPTLASLTLLQRKHLLNIPFENLDIHWGNPISLNTDSLFDKIIDNGRGGFCYELNGLFHALLSSLGFDVRMISARVYHNETFSPAFDHMALLVTIDGRRWLTDVGFGDFIYAPLNIAIGAPQTGPRGTFRIREQEREYYLVQHQNTTGSWEHEYLFTTKARNLDDFADRCDFHQHSEESHFSRKKICSKATPSGRITATDEKLKNKPRWIYP